MKKCVKQPKISVIIPAYKTKEYYLKRAVDNILNDKLQDIELIIVNDGADEGVRNFIQSYDDKRIRYYETQKAHGGPSKARNKGLKYAKGEYVFFHDHDDYLYSEGDEKNALERMYKNAKKENSDILFFDTSTRQKPTIQPPLNSALIDKYSVFFSYEYFCMWALLIKRNFLIDNKIYFNEKLKATDDIIIFFEMIFNNPKMTQCHERCYTHGAVKYSICEQFCFSDIYYKDAKFIAYLKQILKKHNKFEALKIPFAGFVLDLMCYWKYCYLNKKVSPLTIKKYMNKYIKMLEISNEDFELFDDNHKIIYLYFV